MSLIVYNDIREIVKYKKYLQSTGKPFEMHISNYTTKFICPELAIRTVFTETKKSYKFFAVSKKIEIEVLPKLDTFFFKDKFDYFLIKKTIENLVINDNFYCVDINGAYPQVLKNDKLISEKLYLDLLNLPKKDRLASIGMLASEKECYLYKGNEVTELPLITKPTKKVFFHCVGTINDLMQNLSLILEKEFLFYWVDGIFLSNFESATIAKKYIEKKGYKCTIQKCSQPQIIRQEKSNILSFWIESKDSLFNTLKRYTIPKTYGTLKKDLKKYIYK
jgi:hypothetical protein